MTFVRFARLAAVGGLVLLAADASAQSIGDAELACTEGRFLEAADIAEALGTSDGYAQAAKSLAVYGHYVATEEETGTRLSNARFGWAKRPCAPIRPTPKRISNPPTRSADMLKRLVR